jgi:hypothetical protein
MSFRSEAQYSHPDVVRPSGALALEAQAGLRRVGGIGWQGLRLVAADGSAVRLTTMKDGVRSIVTGGGFRLVLGGIELFLHFRLLQSRCAMSARCSSRRSTTCAHDDVLLLDRGFPVSLAGVSSDRTRDSLSVSVAISLARIQGSPCSSCTPGQSEQLVVCGRRMRGDAERRCVCGDADDRSPGAGRDADRTSACGDDFAV